MRRRTSFELTYNGVVRCNCGSVRNFAADICEFIIPMLEHGIKVEFNRKPVYVTVYDNEEVIVQKLMNAMR